MGGLVGCLLRVGKGTVTGRFSHIFRRANREVRVWRGWCLRDGVYKTEHMDTVDFWTDFLDNDDEAYEMWLDR
jgi:hypothetical protein